MSKVTDEDIRDRFEVDAAGVIRWRRVWPAGGEPFAIRAAQSLNRNAGKAVAVRDRDGYEYVVLYGNQVGVARLRSVLRGVSRPNIGGSGSKGGVKASGLPQGITRHGDLFQVRIYRAGRMRFVGMYEALGDAVIARQQAEAAKAVAHG